MGDWNLGVKNRTEVKFILGLPTNIGAALNKRWVWC